MKKITVLGLGYIGFPTALLLADGGNEVLGFDVLEEKIDSINSGKLPFEEKGLEGLFSRVLGKGNFKAVSKLESSDVFIIAVPTPHLENKLADLSYIFSAIDSINKIMEDGNLIILESTIGVSDCDKRIIPELKKSGKNFLFAHVPEKAIPGNTLKEMVENVRVIGGLTEEAAQEAKNLYTSFVKGEIVLTSPIIAAASKVMENTYRDVNIALANELAKVAEDLGFNVWEAIEIANHHPRVNIHQPGPGVGGHCIPIDPWFFVGESNQTKLIPLARAINDGMAVYICNQVIDFIKEREINNPTIGILGYAYKKNVDDSRETPAEKIIDILAEKYEVLVTDPFVKKSTYKITPLDQLLNECSFVILVTDHDLYKEIEFGNYPNIKLIYDSRNVFTNENINESNVELVQLGKPGI